MAAGQEGSQANKGEFVHGPFLRAAPNSHKQIFYRRAGVIGAPLPIDFLRRHAKLVA
jgi:hypothetical protein